MTLTFKKLHILVVEDILPMQQLLVQILDMLGVGRLSKARDGREGYQMYLRGKPDIILTDWQMPDIDGLAFIQEVRRAKASPNRAIPIIMMTGFCAPERISLARDNGCTEFLVKPFSANDLAKRITHIIKKPRDFIVTAQFAGPDRRRKRDEDYQGLVRREKETDQRIEAQSSLEQKTGIGALDPTVIKRSQKVIDNNKINFIPIAQHFLSQLKNTITAIKQEQEPGRRAIESMILPIMQIKANAYIFKYALVGNLANITLRFLESINEIDDYVIEIIESQYTTLSHLIDREMKGDGDHIGMSLEKELEDVCQRYMKIRQVASKNRLKKL